MKGERLASVAWVRGSHSAHFLNFRFDFAPTSRVHVTANRVTQSEHYSQFREVVLGIRIKLLNKESNIHTQSLNTL